MEFFWQDLRKTWARVRERGPSRLISQVEARVMEVILQATRLTNDGGYRRYRSRQGASEIAQKDPEIADRELEKPKQQRIDI